MNMLRANRHYFPSINSSGRETHNPHYHYTFFIVPSALLVAFLNGFLVLAIFVFNTRLFAASEHGRVIFHIALIRRADSEKAGSGLRLQSGYKG